MNESHQVELALAKERLTKVSIAARVSNTLGTPIEGAMQRLPQAARKQVDAVTRKALDRAMDAALFTLGSESAAASNRSHKIAAATTGAVGGAFGIAALSIELPISTTIILRSIADIARSEGEDLKSPSTRLICLEVLALGGKTPSDDAAESGYFAMRAALASAVSEAASHISKHGLSSVGSPALVRLVSEVAARFSIPVSQKVIAQSIPAVGAAGGAIINTIFMDHFQNLAKGHFVVRRLERLYGNEMVQSYY